MEHFFSNYLFKDITIFLSLKNIHVYKKVSSLSSKVLKFSQYSHYGTVDNLLIFCHLAFQEKIIGFEHLLKSLIAFIKHLAEVRMITNDIHSKGERPLSSNLVSNEYTT